MMSGISGKDAERLYVAMWLFGLSAMVVIMVLIGGVTRLTESGLSIVDWRPVTGWLPPLGDTQWGAAFEAYKQFPEYQKVNAGMTLVEFKGIFWLEYIHRLWGRLLGVAFLVPFIVFIWRGVLTRRQLWKLTAVLALGAAQGVMGWYMVKSGLVDRPDVSQYRLVAHLALALLILGCLEWLALEFYVAARPPVRPSAPEGLFMRGAGLAGIVLLTALSGGLVAGLNAGYIYNTFPLMGGDVVPADYWNSALGWLNAFENRAAIQFHHRILAVGTIVTVLALWWRWRGTSAGTRAGVPLATVAAVVVIQGILGITTLLLVVPVPLAALHQAGAVLLFSATLWLVFSSSAGTARNLSG